MFNDGDSAYLTRDLGTSTAGSGQKFTFSAWVKRGILGTDQYLFSSKVSTHQVDLCFKDDDTLRFRLIYGGTVYGNLRTNAKFRDPGAWLHVVVNMDTTQSTDTNRNKMYVNGSQITSLGTSTRPNQNSTFTVNNNTVNNQDMSFGRNEDGPGDYFDGYMAEVVWIDGTAYAASDFGEYNEDSPNIWQPKDVSGLTFGTHGVYLDFEDSGDLDDDESGNGNDFTATNLAATDQMLDTCTNNFCTMNPLDQKVGGTYTFSEGNLQVEQDIIRGTLSNFGITAGKWYAEAKFVSTNSDSCRIGIVGISNVDNDNPGKPATGYVYDQDGNKSNNNTAASYGDTYSTGDIIGIAVDLTNLKIYFSKNGTFQDSGDPTSGGTGTGAAYTITAASGTPAGAYFFTHCDNADTNKVFWNFGSPAFAISSGNADDNGYGNFEYDVPAGYLALCTKNLGSDGG